jgi:glycosyltransferase involved in cell wall biosynthesis
VARIPVILAVDIEPDRRVVTRRPEPLLGFEKLLTLMAPLRDQLAAVVGAPVNLTWLLRMDPQIVEAYGSSTALAEMYGRELTELETAGDEIGLHIHCWRWQGHWIEDSADIGWLEHCTDVALRGYVDAFDRQCRASSNGDRIMWNRLYRQLDDAGVVADITIEPGLGAVRRQVGSEVATGWLPDVRTAPTHAYRPARRDFRLPDPTRTEGLVMLPQVPGVSISLVPVGDRLVPTGTYETLKPWIAPPRFREMLRLRLAAPTLTHLAFTMRSDIALLSDEWAATEINLIEVARQLGEQRWCTASAAVAELTDAAGRLRDVARPDLLDDDERGRWWYHGRADPGFREGIELEALDLTDRSVVPVSDDPDLRRPVVSAILPVFNGGAHLADAVLSATRQTLPPDELIVVDDGSTDQGQFEFLDSIPAPFPIRIVRQPNAGQSVARNRGAAEARGALLAFLDQDDVWHPQHLATLVASFVNDPELAWAYHDFDEIDGDGRVVMRSFLHQHAIAHPKQTLRACIERDLMVVPSTSVVSRAAFEALGGFDESLRGYEDDDLYVRGFRSGWRFAFHAEALTAFRVHESSDSVSTRFIESRVRYGEKLRDAIVDDKRANRYYFRDFVAPRFFTTSLDDYVRAISARDWNGAKQARDALRHFGRLRGRKPRVRLLLLRSPRLFRVLVRLNDALPARLRPARSEALRLR